MRLYALGFLMLLAAFVLGLVGRRLVGRLVRGPAVAVLGIVLGALAVFLMGYLVEGVGLTGWIYLGESGTEVGLKLLTLYGWNAGALAGLVGAVVGSLGRRATTPPPPPGP